MNYNSYYKNKIFQSRIEQLKYQANCKPIDNQSLQHNNKTFIFQQKERKKLKEPYFLDFKRKTYHTNLIHFTIYIPYFFNAAELKEKRKSL